MTAVLSNAGQQQQMPLTQTLQPTSMDTARDVDRQEIEPREDQIQAQEAPSAQTQSTNEGGNAVTSLNIKDIAEFLTALQNMSADDKALPERGAVLNICV